MSRAPKKIIISEAQYEQYKDFVNNTEKDRFATVQEMAKMIGGEAWTEYGRFYIDSNRCGVTYVIDFDDNTGGPVLRWVDGRFYADEDDPNAIVEEFARVARVFGSK